MFKKYITDYKNSKSTSIYLKKDIRKVKRWWEKGLHGYKFEEIRSDFIKYKTK